MYCIEFLLFCIQTTNFYFQDCFAETRDWRKCQTEVRNFRDCMNMYEKKKKQDGKI